MKTRLSWLWSTQRMWWAPCCMGRSAPVWRWAIQLFTFQWQVPPPPPMTKLGGRGMYWNHNIHMSLYMCLSIQNLSGQYFLNCSAFCSQTWYGCLLSWAGESCGKTGLLSSRSRSQQELIWSKYVYFYCTVLTSASDPFVTKLALMVHDHRPEYPVKKIEWLFKVKVTAKA